MRLDFKHNKDDIIEFLNSTADSFYNGKLEFLDRSYESRYKANLLGGMIDIERTIRGTFGCDFSLITADYNLIKNMYPHACEMLNINSQDDLPRLSELLFSLRDLNAHAFLSDNDIAFLKHDFSMLLNEKKMHDSLTYLNNERITVAGITFLILNFLRPQSISSMAGDDFMIAVVANGQYSFDKCERFVSEISHVDLEMPIRKIQMNDILGSIFGEYNNSLIKTSNSFALSIGKETYPTFKVSGTLTNNHLVINKGTLTRTYYLNEYHLKIDDVNNFVTLSNSLPMMALVDFLYESKIKTFDKETFKKIKNDFELYSKTNKPKFYADKKLSLLLFKSNASDFRIISSLVVDALSRIFLSLENLIYRTRGIQRRNKSNHTYEYSTIGKALKHIDVPDEIITEVKYLRNFCAHGYMLHDYLLYKDDVRQFTLQYIISTIKQLSDYLEDNVKDVYNNFKEYKTEFLINKIVKTKYKIAIAYTDVVINEYPNFDIVELSKKNGFINNSFFDVTMFNEITSFEIQKTRVIELLVNDIKQHLYFYENEKSRRRIDFFCGCFGYEITDIKDYGLIIEMTAIKNRQ